jgi:hypothetical protein
MQRVINQSSHNISGRVMELQTLSEKRQPYNEKSFAWESTEPIAEPMHVHRRRGYQLKSLSVTVLGISPFPWRVPSPIISTSVLV